LADEFAAEVQQMCAITVTNDQWAKFLDAHAPRLDVKGEPLKGRSLTMADNKRDALYRLYRHDHRVARWTGTAQGVLQAVNTANTTRAPSVEPPEPSEHAAHRHRRLRGCG
jgi:hypothetical protein